MAMETRIYARISDPDKLILSQKAQSQGLTSSLVTRILIHAYIDNKVVIDIGQKGKLNPRFCEERAEK